MPGEYRRVGAQETCAASLRSGQSPRTNDRQVGTFADGTAVRVAGSWKTSPQPPEVAVIPVKQAVDQFLGAERIAVTGVSRSPKDHGANVVYKRLRDRGYTVFAVNPHAGQVEGDTAYRDLSSVPAGVQAVVIGTSPEHALGTVRECVELGIGQVWMHRGPGAGSVSAEATSYGREHGVTVIDGGCPCMFDPAADTGHKIMRLVGMGHLPKRV
jgi:predicted CoA-binding protein